MTDVSTPAGRRGTRRALRFVLLLGLLAAVLSACVLDDIRARYGVEVVTEGQTWDEEGLSAVVDALERLPDHVVRRLGNRYYGRLHVLSNADGAALDGWQPFSEPANYYSNFGDRNELVLVPGQSVRTILHELGHAYQMREVPSDRYAWVFFQSEMGEFMEATGWKLLSTDEEVAAARSVAELRFSYAGERIWGRVSNDDPVEDYANAFALYFWDPDELERLSPERFSFIDGHVASDAR
jgi:hypothetical protein